MSKEIYYDEQYNQFWPVDDNIGNKMTNADKIRGMSNEELANLLCDHSCMLCPMQCCGGRMEVGRDTCYKVWHEWLNKEFDERLGIKF